MSAPSAVGLELVEGLIPGATICQMPGSPLDSQSERQDLDSPTLVLTLQCCCYDLICYLFLVQFLPFSHAQLPGVARCAPPKLLSLSEPKLPLLLPWRVLTALRALP